MFDRETRREKIIEAKLREIKLKTKTSAKPDTAVAKDKHAQLAEAEARLIQEAEKEFMELIETAAVSYLSIYTLIYILIICPGNTKYFDWTIQDRLNSVSGSTANSTEIRNGQTGRGGIR